MASYMYAAGTAPVRLSVGAALCFLLLSMMSGFYAYSHQFAERSSQPQIMFKAQPEWPVRKTLSQPSKANLQGRQAACLGLAPVQGFPLTMPSPRRPLDSHST